MADTDEAKPSDLAKLYCELLTAIEHCWRQKLRFKVRHGYHKIAKRYWCFIACHECCPDHPKHDKHHKRKHEQHCCLQCMKHAVNCRLEQQEQDFDSVLDTVATFDEVKPAYEATLAAFQVVYTVAGDVLASAKEQNDHPTQKIAGDVQCGVEHFMTEIKAQLRQIKDLGDTYLVTA